MPQEWDRLDVLMNYAGIGEQGGVADNSDDEWHRAQRQPPRDRPHHPRGPPRAEPPARGGDRQHRVDHGHGEPAAARPLQHQRGGRARAHPRDGADHLTEGIRVNCVHPGTADTPSIGRLLERVEDPAAECAALEARQQHGRLVSADAVGAVVYLASPLSWSTTGTAVVVDGEMQEQ